VHLDGVAAPVVRVEVREEVLAEQPLRVLLPGACSSSGMLWSCTGTLSEAVPLPRRLRVRGEVDPSLPSACASRNQTVLPSLC